MMLSRLLFCLLTEIVFLGIRLGANFKNNNAFFQKIQGKKRSKFDRKEGWMTPVRCEREISGDELLFCLWGVNSQTLRPLLDILNQQTMYGGDYDVKKTPKIYVSNLNTTVDSC